MSYKATLNITASRSGRSDFDVMSCHFNFRVPIDGRGRATGHLTDGLIYVEIESNESSKFFGMITTNESFRGKITFYKPDSDQRLKQIEFENGILVQYSESMVSTGNIPMLTNITISAARISLEGETTVSEWMDSRS